MIGNGVYLLTYRFTSDVYYVVANVSISYAHNVHTYLSQCCSCTFPMFLLFEGFSKLHNGREEDQSKLFQAIMQHRLNPRPNKLAD